MANIYEKQAVSDFSNKFYSHEGNSGQWLMKEGEKLQGQAEKTEDKAKTTYSNALNVDWQNSMNSLINNPKYSADPKALQEESRKLTEKMSKEIVDDDVKVDFLVNANLKGQSYANKAYSNQQKIQSEREKSSLFDSVYSGIDTMSLSFSNGLTGNGTDFDLTNFLRSKSEIEQAINKRDAFGTYVFSDTQRLKAKEDLKKSLLGAVNDAYNNMTDEQRKVAFDMIKQGDYVMGYVDTDNGRVPLKMSDVLDQESIRKVRNFAENFNEKEYQRKKRELQHKDFESLLKQDANEESLQAELFSPDLSYEEKLNKINEMELVDDISTSYASKARRYIQRFDITKEKTISDAEEVNSIVQMTADLINTPNTSEEYLVGLKNIRERILDSTKINQRDKVKLINQVSSLTRNRTSQETQAISFSLGEANEYINNSLPADLRATAVRDVFYATQGEDMTNSEKIMPKVREIVEGIKSSNRQKVINVINNESKVKSQTNTNLDSFFGEFGL